MLTIAAGIVLAVLALRALAEIGPELLWECLVGLLLILAAVALIAGALLAYRFH